MFIFVTFPMYLIKVTISRHTITTNTDKRETHLTENVSRSNKYVKHDKNIIKSVTAFKKKKYCRKYTGELKQ